MKRKIRMKGKILFKLCQMFHVPSCMLLFFGVSLSLYKYQIPWWKSVCYASPFVLAALGCFALNAYYDYEKDMVNKPYRILPMGLISKQSVLIMGNVIFCLSIVAATIAADGIHDFLLYFLIIAAAYGYGRYIDYISKIKAFYTAIVLAMPVLFVVVRCHLDLNVSALFIAVVFYISGKELLMDIYDMEGDKAAGQYTLPVRWGEKKIFILSVILQISTMLLCAFRLHIKYNVIVPCCLELFICYWAWQHMGRVWRRNIVYLLWIPLIIVLFIVI